MKFGHIDIPVFWWKKIRHAAIYVLLDQDVLWFGNFDKLVKWNLVIKL